MSVHTHAVINKRRYKVDRTPQSVASTSTLLTPVSVMSRASAAASSNAGRKRRAKRRAARRVQLTPDSTCSPECVQYGCVGWDHVSANRSFKQSSDTPFCVALIAGPVLS